MLPSKKLDRPLRFGRVFWAVASQSHVRLSHEVLHKEDLHLVRLPGTRVSSAELSLRNLWNRRNTLRFMASPTKVTRVF